MCRRQTTLLAGAILLITAHAQEVVDSASRKEFVNGFGGPPMGKDGFVGDINPLPRPQGLRDLGDIGGTAPKDIFQDVNSSFNNHNHITGSIKAPSFSTTKGKNEQFSGVSPQGNRHNLNYINNVQAYKSKSKYPPRSTYSQPAAYRRPESRYNPYGGKRRPQRPYHQPTRYPRPSKSTKAKGPRPSKSVKAKGIRPSASVKAKGGWVRPGPRHQQQRYRTPTYTNRPKYHNNWIKRRQPARVSIG